MKRGYLIILACSSLTLQVFVQAKNLQFVKYPITAFYLKSDETLIFDDSADWISQCLVDDFVHDRLEFFFCQSSRSIVGFIVQKILN